MSTVTSDERSAWWMLKSRSFWRGFQDGLTLRHFWDRLFGNKP